MKQNTNAVNYEEVEKRIEVREQTNEIDTPKGIVDFLEKKNGIFNFDFKNRYSVTELVNCQRKSYYKQLGVEQEELLADVTVERMWTTVRGDFLHQMTNAYKWREMDMEYKVILDDGRKATVAGRLDMYDWKTGTVMDLKTTKNVRWQIKKGYIPKLEHILQVQCYDTMFSSVIPIENLNIVYADMQDIVTYNVKKNDLSDWIKTRITDVENSIIKKLTPNGEPSGVCQFCKYQTRCFNDGKGIDHKPMSTPKRKEGDK